jgi:N-acetylmuramoyl-L-alanine amidase
VVLASPDGKNWVSESSGTTSDLAGVGYGNGTFVAVGAVGAVIQAAVSGQPGQTPSPAPVITPGAQLAVFTIGQSSYFLDGQSYNTDAAPFISNGRTLVPVRYLAEALGAQTNWDATTQKITITKGSTTIELTINSATITTNGKAGKLDAAPLLVNGRTYLPARYIAEALGYTVEWNATAQTVNIVGKQ